jgi:hypothetical protein
MYSHITSILTVQKVSSIPLVINDSHQHDVKAFHTPPIYSLFAPFHCSQTEMSVSQMSMTSFLDDPVLKQQVLQQHKSLESKFLKQHL